MIHYYNLKNPLKLPSGAVFVDPIDTTVFSVKPRETLLEFINRIAKSREERGVVAMLPEDLKHLVVISISEGVSKKVRDEYFEMVSYLPGIGESVSLAKAVVDQRKRGEAGFLLRQARAAKCHDCVLHKKSATFNKTVLETIAKLAGLKDLTQSAVEKGLGSCGMCGCSLQAKVRFDIASTIAGIAPHHIKKLVQTYGSKAFDKCWMMSECLEDGRLKKVLVGKVQNAGADVSSFMTKYFSEKT